jgi:hypothetical protein
MNFSMINLIDSCKKKLKSKKTKYIFYGQWHWPIQPNLVRGRGDREKLDLVRGWDCYFLCSRLKKKG